jgi:hypothetical protein
MTLRDSRKWHSLFRQGPPRPIHQANRTGTDFVEFNRFDDSTKELVWDGPAAWLERFRSTFIAWCGCGAKILSLT